MFCITFKKSNEQPVMTPSVQKRDCKYYKAIAKPLAADDLVTIFANEADTSGLR